MHTLLGLSSLLLIVFGSYLTLSLLKYRWPAPLLRSHLPPSYTVLGLPPGRRATAWNGARCTWRTWFRSGTARPHEKTCGSQWRVSWPRTTGAR